MLQNNCAKNALWCFKMVTNFFPRGSFQSPNGVVVILSKVTEYQSKQLQRKDWVVCITCLCSLLYVFLECPDIFPTETTVVLRPGH